MRKQILIVAVLVFALMIGWSLSGFTACKVNDKAQVQWKGSWYPATVKKAKGDQCFIHYDGYGKEWDEWVGPDRIKIGTGAAEVVTDSTSGGGKNFKVGDGVSVEWKGSWYPAKVIAASKGKWKIHYDGYDNSWDEWVGSSRIKGK